MGVVVQHQIVVGKHIIVLDFLGNLGAAPQNHPEAGNDLFQGERLGHVIVGTNGQAVNAMFHRILGGEEQDRAFESQGAQLGEELETIHARHHDVKDEGVGLKFGGNFKRLQARGGGGDLKTLEFEADSEQFDNVGLIVDNEHFGGVFFHTVHCSLLTPNSHFDLLSPYRSVSLITVTYVRYSYGSWMWPPPTKIPPDGSSLGLSPLACL